MQIGLARDWKIENFNRRFKTETKICITFLSPKSKENKSRGTHPDAK
jgi:hypothetical protein